MTSPDSESDLHQTQKAVLVGVPLNSTAEDDHLASMAELGRLVSTLGFDVVGSLSQRRPNLAGGTVLGEGKLKELAEWTGGTGIVQSGARQKKTKAAARFEENLKETSQTPELQASELQARKPRADVVVFDCDLSPSQLANIESATGVQVLDRTGVIVEIFNRHAKTREARIQVEIARLNYIAPRLRESGGGKDRIGTAGETDLELDRRNIRDRIAELKRELATVQKDQSGRRKKRSDQPSVALVGYTNAGKSSLMRALTGSAVLVADKLFATLDTTVRALYPESTPRVLVTDTVGFIKKLPHDLVASFRSTLEEAASASLLLFVVDASDNTFRSQLAVTQDVLAEIGVEGIPSILVLNKIDRVAEADRTVLAVEFPNAVQMSTLDKKDVEALREKILSSFESGMEEAELKLSYALKGAVGELRAQMKVLEEEYLEDGVRYRVKAFPETLAKFKKTHGIDG